MQRAATLSSHWPGGKLLALCLALGVAFGLLSSHSDILLAGLGVIALLGLAAAGETALLALILVSAGITLSFITGGERPFIPALGGANLDGIKLVAVLGAFLVLAIRNPSLLDGISYLKIYVAFLAFACVSLLWTTSIQDGVRLLCKLVYPGVVFLLAFRVVRERGDDDVIRYLCFGAIAATAVNLVVALSGWSPYQGLGYEDRYSGAAHPNSIGLYCAATGLLVYALWTRRRSRGLLALAVLLGLQLVATGSRTALVAGGLSLVMFEFLRGKWRHVPIALGVGIAVWLLVPTLGARTAEVNVDSGLGSQMNISGRAVLWADAWVSFIGDGSLIGHGLGATDAFFESRYLGLRSVHNGYLLLLGDTGFLGLALALAFFLVMAWMFLRQRRTGLDSSYAVVSVSMIVMLLLASTMESTFGGYGLPQAPLWVVMGVACALRRGTAEV